MRALPFCLRAFYLTAVKRVKVGAALGDEWAAAHRATAVINPENGHDTRTRAALTDRHTTAIFVTADQCATSADNCR